MNIYDRQIAELTENPEGIQTAWVDGEGLFKFLGDSSWGAGCITLIKKYDSQKVIVKEEVNEELTKEIKEDERLPSSGDEIRPKHLPLFKYYQEKYDKLLNK